MRTTPATAAVTLLVFLLTWLSLRAANTDAEQFDVVLREMDRLQALDATLHRDVLSARVGVLRNYDPLVRETNALDASVGRLRQLVTTDTETASAIDRLAIAVDQQGRLVEQFKSDNALLQNSLAYFALFSSEWDGSVAPLVSSLAASVLRLTLDTSAESARAVQDRLDVLASQPLPFAEANPARALLAHGHLLHDLLPATDDVLKALFAVPQERDQEILRAAILAQQSASRITTSRFRILLYVVSLVLVARLVYLGLRLQARSRALRHRAAFEHVLAGISMRFITARAQDLDWVIEQALADMARCLGVERAYFIVAGALARSYTWCRQGVAFAPGWPDQALLLVDRNNPTVDGIVHVPHVKRMPFGAERDTLTAAGLRGWTCVFHTGVDGGRNLLGFDSPTHSCLVNGVGDLGLLRMALDVIANALGRQSFEQERARLEQRLEQARRLETLGTLASGIAHDFNNIIGAILGYTEMASEQYRSASFLEEIRRAGERARELVDQILTFARRRDVRRNPVSIRALTAEATSLLRASLPATVEIVVRELAEELTVSGVHVQLQQVVLNLCKNAAQAMDQVGRIELEIEAVDVVTARTLSHGALAPGGYVRIAVGDTGRGIDEAALGRIFEPFFTTRLVGSGLGLATTRDIVREHDGAMHVESTVGAGSRFEVWLPCVSAVASTFGQVIVTLPFGHGETILVVEQDTVRLLRDEEIFAALGYEPVGFTHAAEAHARCRESPECFDAVVVGQLAPTAEVLDFALALHGIAPTLPILLAAASADDFAAKALATAGISDVVAWPINATEMATTLQDCLRRKDSQRDREATRNDRQTVQYAGVGR